MQRAGVRELVAPSQRPAPGPDGAICMGQPMAACSQEGPLQRALSFRLTVGQEGVSAPEQGQDKVAQGGEGSPLHSTGGQAWGRFRAGGDPNPTPNPTPLWHAS